mgnify:CR=1 FL=1
MSEFLVGSANAMYRFGLLGGVSDSPKSVSTPKFSDLWYLEMYDDKSNVSNIYSKSVKSVSEVGINVTHATIDQYGKRIHVPQRVDFPAVTVVLYDTIDGKMFDLISSIYEYNFKNNKTQTMERNTAIRDISSSGIKPRDTASQPHNHYFTQVNIYHFFGHLTQSVKHKITLSNPLISGISFSNHDYSSSELRTITLTLEPENIFIDAAHVHTETPSWITAGVPKSTSSNNGK